MYSPLRAGRPWPDIVGRRVEASDRERVEVLVPRLDGRLAVEIVRADSPAEEA